ncbi:hypothetical protein NMY22_g19260 [Coprinellus aureogranulatus]|nr:hypothetical protein NMY22_g19260 [Coprinellus aureogranulatus]
MPFSLTFVTSLLVASAAAAIVKVCPVKAEGCTLKDLSMPELPASLPAPTQPLAYVSVAIGTQNYTCSPEGKYASAGAVAELFDISCLVGSALFDTIPDRLMDLWKDAPDSMTADILTSMFYPGKNSAVLGQHYFVPNPSGQGLSPKWDFTSTGRNNGNKNAYVLAARAGGAPAPTGAQDIDWLALTSVSGGLAKEVYRTDTRQGQPPASCTPGSPPIQVKYSSKYWLYGSSAGKATRK